MFIAQTLMDALGSMALLLDNPLIVFEDLVDHRDERIQLRADRQSRSPIPWRNGMQQDLCHRLTVDPEKTRSGTLAHTFNMACQTDPAV
ncbi:hypothetical protein ACW9UM_04285 [Marinovum sp. KMM 9989]